MRLSILFILLVISTTQGEESKLLSVVQVFRHGHRTPLFFSKTDKHSDPTYWNGLRRGELTELGKKQQRDLGVFFRKRYADFLPARYERSDITVKVSHSRRTYDSAKAFLEGLYPDDFQLVPLHKAGRSALKAIMNCPRYYLYHMRLMGEHEYFLDVERRNKEMYQYLDDHLQLPLPSLITAFAMWDCLGLESQQNLTLEEWAGPMYPFPLEYTARNVSLAMCHNEEMQRLGIGTLMEAVTAHFEAHLRKPKEKVVLFSGHDINISCLLNTFGVYKVIEPNPPPFASSIILELRRNEYGVYVNGYYKHSEEVQPIRFKDCDFDCNFDQFKRIFQGVRLTEWEWLHECLTLI